MAWSGTGFVLAFEADELVVEAEDEGSNRFDVSIDGAPPQPWVLAPGRRRYVLARDLERGLHQVVVARRTEALFGVTTIRSIEISADGVARVPRPPLRKLELVGDSITTGYGVEADSPNVPFSAATQNHGCTYGALAARALACESSTVAWSGKGVVCNYHRDEPETMLDLYERVLPGDPASRWTFSWVPDVVVVNLGTNDFAVAGAPSPAAFEAGYVRLLAMIRRHAPEAFILCTVGNMLVGRDLARARAGIHGAVEAFVRHGGGPVEAFDMKVSNARPGSDWHPGRHAHRRMAEVLVAELRARHRPWAEPVVATRGHLVGGAAINDETG